ncbi:hypothetical protein I79_022395 [Cricetulus griseus]|uniref:Secreted protein n=1 Tax=Cricetulus griseus TaxID=10029 RepID=G3IF78_CRIGR|nr:hypothetical protein I79_022395 [Cricetulus griseus]
MHALWLPMGTASSALTAVSLPLISSSTRWNLQFNSASGATDLLHCWNCSNFTVDISVRLVDFVAEFCRGSHSSSQHS